MQRRQSIRIVIVRFVGSAATLVLFASAAAGQGGDPVVGLDALLKIPPTVSFEPTKRGHGTKSEWRSRFDEARGDLQTAERQLAQTQKELAEIGSASSAWTMGAPGMSSVDREVANEKPLDLTLSKQMKQRRAAVETAEARMRELDVEANLAQVPEDWRGTPKPAEETPQAPQASR